MNITATDRRLILEDALAWLVVLAMCIYGLAKWMQFPDTAMNDTAVSDMSGMELMWAFYGYSKPFAVFLGVLEVSGAMMLLYRPFRLMGALFLSTVLVNIIVQDIAFGVHAGALRVAILYQVTLLIICWLHRHRFITAFKALKLPRSYKGLSWPQIATRAGLAFALFVVLRFGEHLWMRL